MKFLYFLLNLFFMLFGIIHFYINIHISHFIYFYFPYDTIRQIVITLSSYFLFICINMSFYNRITFNKKLKNINQINLINSNHVHSIDTIILFYLFYNSNINLYSIFSISTENNISIFEKKIFELANSLLVNKNLNNNFGNFIFNLKKRTYNIFIPCFFEGICLRDVHKSYDLTYLNYPKYYIFELFCKEFSGKKFYDIDIVYIFNNQLMDPKDKYFIFKILHPDCKIILDIKLCTFPKNNEKDFLNKLYEKKNKNIEKILKTI